VKNLPPNYCVALTRSAPRHQSIDEAFAASLFLSLQGILKRTSKSSRPLTAAELKLKLARDPDYLQMKEEKELAHRESVEQYKAAEAPIVADLKHAGFDIKSIDELRRSGMPYESAVPVLLKWLPAVTDAALKDSIVRALSVPWARPAAAPSLIQAFRSTLTPSSLKWTIGNALAIAGDDSVFHENSKPGS